MHNANNLSKKSRYSDKEMNREMGVGRGRTTDPKPYTLPPKNPGKKAIASPF